MGHLLRHWRDLRGRSQIDLSLDAGVSQRHISFVESGRSVPSRRLLMDIADALDVPLTDRNALLSAAGYAAMYSSAAWDSIEMQGITRALERMLRQQDPYPALVMDRHWNVLQTNRSAPRFFNCFVDMSARRGPRNMLHLLFDPQGMQPFIADWPTVARSLIQRVSREAVGRVLDEQTNELLASLRQFRDRQDGAEETTRTASLPVIPIGFMRNGRTLNFFSMVTTVGTPQAVAAQELRIESMFPADEATEALYARMIDAVPGS